METIRKKCNYGESFQCIRRYVSRLFIPLNRMINPKTLELE